MILLRAPNHGSFSEIGVLHEIWHGACSNKGTVCFRLALLNEAYFTYITLAPDASSMWLKLMQGNQFSTLLASMVSG